MCFYAIGLWRLYRAVLSKLAAAYVKSIKIFFGYRKYYCYFRVDGLELGLPSFYTVFLMLVLFFKSRPRVSLCANCLVKLCDRVCVFT